LAKLPDRRVVAIDPVGGGRAQPVDGGPRGHSSVYLVLKDRGAARKLYFIQDFEPLFYPAGTSKIAARRAWRSC
jgi:hypothetical protein